jgi:hypothetical protein
VILAPEQTDRNECRDDIQSILVIVEGIRVHVDFIKDRSSYKSIIAIPTYEAALRRLVNAGDALTKYWRSQLYPDELVGLLKDAINRCKPAVPGPAQAAPKASRSARGSSQKLRVATYYAWELLFKWGHEPTLTRRGKWDRLAGILYGDPEKTFSRHMTIVQREIIEASTELLGKWSFSPSAIKRVNWDRSLFLPAQHD